MNYFMGLLFLSFFTLIAFAEEESSSNEKTQYEICLSGCQAEAAEQPGLQYSQKYVNPQNYEQRLWNRKAHNRNIAVTTYRIQFIRKVCMPECLD